jgi:hypothetical protein
MATSENAAEASLSEDAQMMKCIADSIRLLPRRPGVVCPSLARAQTAGGGSDDRFPGAA